MQVCDASILPVGGEVMFSNTGGVFHSNLTSMQGLELSYDRFLHLIRTLSKHATICKP